MLYGELMFCLVPFRPKVLGLCGRFGAVPGLLWLCVGRLVYRLPLCDLLIHKDIIKHKKTSCPSKERFDSRLGLLSLLSMEICPHSGAVAHVDAGLEGSDRSTALEG